MRKVLSILLTLVIAVGIFVTGCAPSQPAVTTPPATTGPKAPTGEPIKFGATVTLADITGKEASNAMLLAAKEINAAGGVLGRPLQIVIADDQGKGEVGASSLDKLATVDNVYAFIGGMSSGVHMAQIPILKKYAKPTVTIGADATTSTVPSASTARSAKYWRRKRARCSPAFSVNCVSPAVAPPAAIRRR